MNLRFPTLMAAFAALLCAPMAHAQFELKGGATNLLDKRKAGGSPTVFAGGVVTSITVRGGGSGYTSAPAVTIAPPTSGKTARATATIVGGVVTAVTINTDGAGSGYDSANPPAVVIAPPTVPAGTPVTLVQFAGQAATAATAGAIAVPGTGASRAAGPSAWRGALNTCLVGGGRRAAGVADVTAPVVAGSVAEVYVGAVDVSPRLGLAAEAGLRRGPKGSLSVDVLKCSRCLGPMRLIACIEEPDVAKKFLEHLGLLAEPLPTLRAQAPPVALVLFHEA